MCDTKELIVLKFTVSLKSIWEFYQEIEGNLPWNLPSTEKIIFISKSKSNDKIEMLQLIPIEVVVT